MVLIGRSSKIGIIGGTGFYSLFSGAESAKLDNTGAGKAVSIGYIGGRAVAFIPRHGSNHTIPPHKIQYKENIETLHRAGVERVISSTAVGSLRRDYRIGDFVFTDQFINMTSGRESTFFDSEVRHVSTAYPYCTEMRRIAAEAAERLGLSYHSDGTVVIINGPRFSTKAESKFFRSIGADIINMTQYPEVALARERAMCYLNISIITDYDAGLEGEPGEGGEPVSNAELRTRFNENIERLKGLILEIIKAVPDERSCGCKDALVDAE